MAQPLCVTLLLAGLALASASTFAQCSTYTSCADCACSMIDYTVISDCGSGCAWVDELSQCVTPSYAIAQGYNTTMITDMWKISPTTSLNDDEQVKFYDKLIERDLVNCPLQHGAGTVASIIIMFSLCIGYNICVWCCCGRVAALKNLSRMAKLKAAVQASAPANDQILWHSEHIVEPRKGGSDTSAKVSFSVIGTLFLLVPSLIWLLIGLPYTISEDWGFAFFYPIYLVGGFGMLWGIGSLAALSSAQNKHVPGDVAYGLTSNHIILATMNRRGVHVSMHALDHVRGFELSDSNTRVKFTVSGQATKSAPLSGLNKGPFWRQVRPGTDDVTTIEVHSDDALALHGLLTTMPARAAGGQGVTVGDIAPEVPHDNKTKVHY